jgi:hypothetical protein
MSLAERDAYLGHRYPSPLDILFGVGEGSNSAQGNNAQSSIACKPNNPQGLCGKHGTNRQFTQLIQYDTIYCDLLLTDTIYSSIFAIPDTNSHL